MAPRWIRALAVGRSGLVALLACAPLVMSPGAEAQDQSFEYAVKATYLYKFAPFVEWPSTAFGAASDPLVLCIIGEDPFGTLIDRAVAGQRVGDRPIRLQRIDAPDEAAGCHVAYIGRSPDFTAEDVLDALRGLPVLTVTDSALDPEARGIIHFVLQENRVRFTVDDEAAAANGLRISSKLLSLAVSVRLRDE